MIAVIIGPPAVMNIPEYMIFSDTALQSIKREENIIARPTMISISANTPIVIESFCNVFSFGLSSAVEIS